MPQIIDHPGIPGAKQVVLLPSEPRASGSIGVVVNLDKLRLRGTAGTPGTINVTVITSRAVVTVTPTLSPADAEITFGTVTGSGSSWNFTITVAKTGSTEVTRTVVVSVVAADTTTGTGATLFTVDNAAPVAPSNLTASGVSNGIQLNWTASPSSDVYQYIIYSEPVGGTPRTEIGRSFGTSFTDAPVTSGTQKWYQVTAVDTVGNESSFSSQATATAQGDVKLTLSLVKTRVSGADTFQASLSSDQAIDSSWLQISVSPTDTDVTFGTVSPSGAGTNYTFNVIVSKVTVGTFTRTVVVQLNTALSGGKSGIGTAAFIIDTQAPGVPTGVTVTSRIQSARVTWTSPGDPDIQYYLVYRNTTNTIPGSYYGKTIDVSFLDTAMDSGQQYFYWVKAVDSVGNIGTASASGNGTDTQVVSTDIQNAAITLAKFNTGLQGIQVVASLGSITSPTQGMVALLTTDNKLYRYTGSAWTTAVPTVDLTGTITNGQLGSGVVDLTKFASGLQPIQVVASTASITSPVQGQVAFQTSDNKLYRYTGTVWVATIPTSDLSGTVGSGQIADGAIIPSKVGFILGGSNILSDSSFERNDNVYWGLYNNGPETAVLIFPTTTPYQGARSAKVTWTATNTSQKGVYAVTGNIVWKPNTTYVVSWYARVTTAWSQGMGLAWNLAPATTTTILNPNLSTTYQRYAFRITWGASVDPNVFFTIQGSAPANDLFFDCMQAEEGEVLTAYAPRVDEILPGSITSTEIADNAITTNKLVAGSVTAGKILANTITAAQIAADTITANEIAANAITANELAANSVIAGKIAAGAITAVEIAAHAITAAQIAAHTITAVEIFAGTITANEIAANTITAGQIAADTITANEIAANAITVNELAANAVTAIKIAANAVTATKLGIVSAAVDPGRFTNNSPGAGRVAWTSVLIVMGGVVYNSIANGSTPDTQNYYIWFDQTFPTVLQLTVRAPDASGQSSFNPVGFNSSQDVLLGTAIGGTFNQVWSGTAIIGDMIQTGTLSANVIHTNTLDAFSADLGIISAGRIQDVSNSSTTTRGIRLNSSYGIPANWLTTSGFFIDLAATFGGDNNIFMQVGDSLSFTLTTGNAISASFRGSVLAQTLNVTGAASILGALKADSGILASGATFQSSGPLSGYGAPDKARMVWGPDSFIVYADALTATASSATANTIATLNDDNEFWGLDQFAGNSYVTLLTGTGAGDRRLITTNTRTQLTVSPAFSGIPSATAQYKIDNVRNLSIDNYTTTLGGTGSLTSRTDSSWDISSDVIVTTTNPGTVNPSSANTGPASGDSITQAGGARSSTGSYTVSYTQRLDTSGMNGVLGTQINVTSYVQMYYRTSSGGAWIDTGLQSSIQDGPHTGFGLNQVVSKSLSFNVPNNPAYVEFKLVPGIDAAYYGGRVPTGSASSRIVGSSGTVTWQSYTAGTGTQIIRRNPRLFSNSYWNGAVLNFAPHLTMEPLTIKPPDANGREGDIVFAAGALHVHNGTAWFSIGSVASSSYVVKTGDSMTGALVVNAAATSPGSPGTYHHRVQVSAVDRLTFGADTNNAYIQSWSNQPLWLNNQGNNVFVGSRLEAQTLRATNFAAPGSGAGLELGWFVAGGYSVVQSYDRTANAYLPLELQGSTVGLGFNGGALGTGQPAKSWGSFTVGSLLTVNASDGLSLAGLSGFSRIYFGAPGHANWKVSVQDTVSDAFEIAVSATSAADPRTLSYSKIAYFTTASSNFLTSYLAVGAFGGSARFQGDIIARRSATTGVIYFGDSGSTYLYWDGSNYNFGPNIALHSGNYNTYAPTFGGAGASGNWNINVTGYSVATQQLGLWDGTSFFTGSNAIGGSGSRGTNLAPQTYQRQVSFEFKDTSFYAGPGNYRGLITFAPWVGTTASTGDSNYQLMFVPAGISSSSTPSIQLRAGIDSAWGAWTTILTGANYAVFVQSASLTFASGVSLTLTGAGTFFNSNWFRSIGTTGWYNETYAVGIWATQAGQVRTYNSSSFFSEGAITSSSSLNILSTNQLFFNSGLAGGGPRMYGASDNVMPISSGSGQSTLYIGLYVNAFSAAGGYIYNDGTNAGLLSKDANWKVQVQNLGGTLFGDWNVADGVNAARVAKVLWGAGVPTGAAPIGTIYIQTS